MSRVDESGRLGAVDYLLQCAVKKGILNIELMYGPVSRHCKAEHSTHGGRLDDGAEGFVEVNAGTLSETAKDPASLVPVEGTVGLELVLEEPLASDDVGAAWPRNEVPGAVGEKGVELILHCSPPIWVSEHRVIGAQDWREDRRMQVETLNGLAHTEFTTGGHDMVVGDGVLTRMSLRRCRMWTSRAWPCRNEWQRWQMY